MACLLSGSQILVTKIRMEIGIDTPMGIMSIFIKVDPVSGVGKVRIIGTTTATKNILILGTKFQTQMIVPVLVNLVVTIAKKR